MCSTITHFTRFSILFVLAFFVVVYKQINRKPMGIGLGRGERVVGQMGVLQKGRTTCYQAASVLEKRRRRRDAATGALNVTLSLRTARMTMTTTTTTMTTTREAIALTNDRWIAGLADCWMDASCC